MRTIYVVSFFDRDRRLWTDEVRDDATGPVVRGARFGELFRDQWFFTAEEARAFLRARYARELTKTEARANKIRELLAAIDAPTDDPGGAP